MTKITIHTLFITVHALKNIKNRSHGNIHIFKNYFVTVLSVFSFSNNKLNPNRPIVYQLYQLGNSKKKKKNNKSSDGSFTSIVFLFFFVFFFFFLSRLGAISPRYNTRVFWGMVNKKKIKVFIFNKP